MSGLSALRASAHRRFSQSSSATALPECRAFVSYLVTGPVTEMGSPAFGVHASQPRLGVADLGDLFGITRVIGSGVQHPAGPQPVGDQGEGGPFATAGVCGGAPSATGLGRTPAPRSANGANMCSRTSTPSPRTSRILVTPSRSTPLSSCPVRGGTPPRRRHRGCGSACAIARVDVPAPQPISSATGADRPNQASVSGGGAGPSAVACVHADLGPQPIPRGPADAPDSVVRRVRKLVTRG